MRKMIVGSVVLVAAVIACDLAYHRVTERQENKAAIEVKAVETHHSDIVAQYMKEAAEREKKNDAELADIDKAQENRRALATQK